MSYTSLLKYPETYDSPKLWHQLHLGSVGKAGSWETPSTYCLRGCKDPALHVVTCLPRGPDARSGLRTIIALEVAALAGSFQNFWCLGFTQNK